MKREYLAKRMSFILLMVFLLPCGWVEAAGFKSLIKGLGKKTYDENTLTKDQLKACLVREKEIKEMTAELKNLSAKLKNEKQELEKEDAQIKAKKKKLDKKDAQAVNDFNKSVGSYNKKVDAYGAKAKKHNEEAAKQREMAKQYNDECSSKKIYESDLKEVQKSLGEN